MLGMSNDLWSARTKSRRPANFNGQTNGRAEAGKHIDKRVGSEEIDAPPEKITDAGLRHAQCPGGSLLFEATSRDELCSWIMRSARTRRCSASSRRNSRSRNTFPVDGVVFDFI